MVRGVTKRHPTHQGEPETGVLDSRAEAGVPEEPQKARVAAAH